MSTREPSRRAALLDELRAAHRSERASDALRRRLLARFATRQPTSVGRHGLSLPPLGALRQGALAFGAIVLVAVGGALSPRLLTLSRLASEGVSSDPSALPPAALALGPEPSGAARKAASALEDPAGDTQRGLDARDSRRGEPGPCPLFAVKAGAMIASHKTSLDSRISGVELHTFEMETPSCGPLSRRYLLQAPPGLAQSSSVPVLIVLHDTGKSAEYMRLDSRWRFDDVARREGILLVYANAAPGAATDVAVDNSGGWQSDPGTHIEVDDEAYLQLILSDLVVRHVIDGNNDVYLAGHGGGAQMALTAVAKQPGAYAGVAAFLPLRPRDIEPPRLESPKRLSRAFFVLDAKSSPRVTTRAIMRGWGRAFGISSEPRQRHWQLGTRWARSAAVEQSDLTLPASGSAAVRALVVDGPFDPFPVSPAGPRLATNPSDSSLRAFDGAADAWAFLSGADGADPGPAEPPDPRELGVDGVDDFADDETGFGDPPLQLDEDVLKARPSKRAR